MNFEKIIQQSLVNIVKELYHQDIDPACLQVNKTRKDQEGDFTVVVFPLSKMVKASPEAIAGQLGDMLVKKLEILEKYNVVKGFLNLFLTNEVWLQYFKTIQNTDFRFFSQDTAQPVVVEFSSPNTNKPLHLGHVRNNLLGCSVCNILEANGHKVVRVNLVNDRGIHICKSMVAWLQSSNGETPKSSGMKGDHLVGKYYVEFDRLYKAEIAALTAQGMDKETAEKQAPILQEAQEMLRKWENGDPEVRSLWKQMNAWVYEAQIDTILSHLTPDAYLITDSSTHTPPSAYTLRRTTPIEFDFNAIAQGYTVDLLAQLYDTLGIQSYLIDVGGEVIARGTKPDGSPWTVGIERPSENKYSNREIETAIALCNQSVVTSGNYRKYYEHDGVRYSHTLNPSTGQPVNHSLLSVSVISRHSWYADAMATAFMVMGLDQSLQFIQQHPDNPDIQAVFFIYNDHGQYRTHATQAFQSLIIQ